MSPNQPPTTDPIDDTNTLFTPEPQERTDINVVTQQDSENISQRLDFSSTPSQIERDRFQTHQQYYTMLKRNCWNKKEHRYLIQEQ